MTKRRRRDRRSPASRAAALQNYRLYAGLYPSDAGELGELWIVKCSKCDFRAGPDGLLEAKRIARVHDAAHNRP